MEKLIALALTTLIGAFIGSFLGSYLKKKGENLATHEDLDKLVEQVRAVTTTTKEIEARISTDVWDRQKRWEMKREVLFDGTKRLGAIQLALRKYLSAVGVRKMRRQDGLSEMPPQMMLDASKELRHAMEKFQETGLLLEIVSGPEVKSACGDFQRLSEAIATALSNTDDLTSYHKYSAELSEKARAVTDAIRKELETDRK